MNVSQNPTSIPSFSSIVPAPADFIGKTITYYNARPYQRTPLLANGIVIGWQVYKNLLLLKVQNTETCRERWINAQFDCLNFTLAVIAAEEPELEDDPEYLEWLYQTEATERAQELAD